MSRWFLHSNRFPMRRQDLRPPSANRLIADSGSFSLTGEDVSFTYTPGTFDPATLALTGWWRASYSGSPWTGTASAGSSASRNITEGTTAPSVGSALNGFTPADFNGSSQYMDDATFTQDDLFNAGAWSAWVLFNADTAAIDQGAGSRFQNPAFWSVAGSAYQGMGFSGSGIQVHQSDGGGYKEIVIACATGGWHLAQAKYDNTNLKLRLDGGSWSLLASGNPPSMTDTFRFGVDWNADAFFDGNIAEIGTTDSALSDADFDNVKDYVNSRYALSL